MDLYTGITQYFADGEVILMGDFNGRTKNLQVPLHDRSEDVFCTTGPDPAAVGLHQISEDALGPTTAYGKHLLHLGESHELLILNCLPCFPNSHIFTCRPHGGGASVVDYALASQSLLPFIRDLSILPIPLADHALLSLSLQIDPPPPTPPPPENTPQTTFRFDEGDLDIFLSDLRQILPPEVQFPSLNLAIAKYQCLSSTIWKAALNSFPHSTHTSSDTTKMASCPMNKRYDEDCKSLHREIRHAFLHSCPTYPNIQKYYRRLLRQKK